MMIEADVNMGFLIGSLELIPIMAHPPSIVSDLSLEAFLDKIIDVRMWLNFRYSITLSFLASGFRIKSRNAKGD